MPLPTTLKRRLLNDLPHFVNRDSATLPQSTTETLFTISGGPIIAFALFGHVDVAVSGVLSITLRYTPDVGGSIYDIGSILVVDDDAAGTIWHQGIAIDDDIRASGQLGTVELINRGWLMFPGTIHLLTSASRTGNVSWFLPYSKVHVNTQVVPN